MDSQCYPIATLPGTTPLFRDFADHAAASHTAALRRWYPANPFSMDWASTSPTLDTSHRNRLADALRTQAHREADDREDANQTEEFERSHGAAVTSRSYVP